MNVKEKKETYEKSKKQTTVSVLLLMLGSFL